MALLEICGISKGFDQNGQPKSVASRAVGSTPDLIRGLPVLRNINLAINENEFVCIVGRSGSGKTTLISLIAGLLQPDEGQILLEGKPVDGPGREVVGPRLDRAFVFQSPALLPWLTARDNVQLSVTARDPFLINRN